MAPTVPCKRMIHLDNYSSRKRERESHLHVKKFRKQEYGCILESRESTRPRAELSQPKHHEYHVAGKGYTSMNHCNLVHKFIPMPQVMKIQDAKAAVDKEWEKARDHPSVAGGESQEQEGDHKRGTEKAKTKSTSLH